MTAGAVAPLRELHADFGARVEFLTVLVREAHPGSRYPEHRSWEQKVRHARDFKDLENIPWTVLVDRLDGDVHRRYGELPDNTVLIDAEGRVAFEVKWTHPPTLRRALEELLDRGGATAPVAGGVSRAPHMLASMVDGWRAVARAGDGAVRDLAFVAAPAVAGMYMGALARPLLAPIALRSRSLPALAKGALGAAVVVGVAALRRRR